MSEYLCFSVGRCSLISEGFFFSGSFLSDVGLLALNFPQSLSYCSIPAFIENNLLKLKKLGLNKKHWPFQLSRDLASRSSRHIEVSLKK